HHRPPAPGPQRGRLETGGKVSKGGLPSCRVSRASKRPVPEGTQQASHSLGGLGGPGDEDGLTGCFLVGPNRGRVTPLGYTSISGGRRFRRGCSQKASTSRSPDSRNFRKLTPRYRHVW